MIGTQRGDCSNICDCVYMETKKNCSRTVSKISTAYWRDSSVKFYNKTTKTLFLYILGSGGILLKG